MIIFLRFSLYTGTCHESHIVTLHYLYGPIIGLRITAQTISGCLHTSSSRTNCSIEFLKKKSSCLFSSDELCTPYFGHHIMVCTIILNLHYIIIMSKTVSLLFLRFSKLFPNIFTVKNCPPPPTFRAPIFDLG